MHKGEEMLNQAQENATETQAASVRVKPGIDYEKLKSIGVPDEVIASLDPRDGGNITPQGEVLFLDEGRLHRSLVCECEAVTAGEVQYAVENLNVNSLLDLRRRTRVGMGTCQGELCACRAAGLLQRFNVTTSAQSIEQLSTFLNERWKGVQPIAWGDALRESEFTRWVYQGLCGLEKEQKDAL